MIRYDLLCRVIHSIPKATRLLSVHIYLFLYRNVSQILSASLNQKSATANSSNPISSGLSLNSALKSSYASALTSGADSASLSGSTLSGSCSLSTPSSARKYVCVDCQKSVSSPRNLQRHRTSCKSAIASSASRSNEMHALNSLPVSSANQVCSKFC